MYDRCMPHFLIVGAAKSGTTLLWYWLRQHSRIFLPAIKEPHYFCFAEQGVPHVGPELDPFYRAGLVTTRDAYENLWDKAGSGQICGEASPGYLYFPETAVRIAAANPKCRIIAILRNPAERAFSQYMHHVRDGYETLETFEDALAAENARHKAGWWWGYHYRVAGLYAAQWQRYCDVFAPEQRLLLTHEDLVAAPQGCYRKICNFLGVAEEAPQFSRRINETAGLKRVPVPGPLQNMLRHGSGLTLLANKLLPKDIRIGLKKTLQTFNSHAAPTLASETAEQLQRYYRHDIEALAKLSELDLSAWHAPIKVLALR